jgi:hypothetical protein
MIDKHTIGLISIIGGSLDLLGALWQVQDRGVSRDPGHSSNPKETFL